MKFLTTPNNTRSHLVKPEKVNGIRCKSYCGLKEIAEDTIHTSKPQKLCNKCRRGYLKDHTEEELFTELI